MLIQILGPGCARCRAVADNARRAVAELGIAAEVQPVEDIEAIMRFGVLTAPAVVVDGMVKGSGRLFSPNEIKGMVNP
jgi:small redox-active disulfide protein 2